VTSGVWWSRRLLKIRTVVGRSVGTTARRRFEVEKRQKHWSWVDGRLGMLSFDFALLRPSPESGFEVFDRAIIARCTRDDWIGSKIGLSRSTVLDGNIAVGSMRYCFLPQHLASSKN
jgi:hypothetical protein